MNFNKEVQMAYKERANGGQVNFNGLIIRILNMGQGRNRTGKHKAKETLEI